jgi:hypothetical protein
MLLLVIDAVLGTMLLVAIALATRAPKQRSGSLRAVGWILVAVPLPAAVALHVAGALSAPVDQTLFVTGVAAFAIGSALVLGSRNDDDWSEEPDGSPPWWPEFERELEDYARRQPVTRA